MRGKQNHVISWVGHSFDKIREDSRPPVNRKNEYTVYMAKGETEGCQMGIYLEDGAETLRLLLLSGANRDVRYASYHVRPILDLGGKIYTDPAVPLREEPLEPEAQKTVALLLEFTTTDKTPAGDYPYEFALVDKDGNVMAKHTVTVRVWDFALPEEKSFAASVAVGVIGDREKAHFDLLLEHNLSTRLLPADILSGSVDDYMSDVRVPTFCVRFYEDQPEENMVKVYEKLKTNPEWIRKAIFYPVDEPRTADMVKQIERKCQRIREICPDIKVFSPFYTNIQMDDELDQLAYTSRFMTAHCPKLSNWDDSEIYTDGQAERYGSFESRMEALRERGDTIWTYVCNYPLSPYLNIKVDDEGIGSRVLFWQIYQRHIVGFLYWNAAYFERLPDRNPWKCVDTFGNGIYGDGILLYPGEGIGMQGPIPSIRMKIMRDGIDDIELFYLAERIFGRAWVDERVNKASSALTSVDVSSDEFYDVRVEIGNAVEIGMKSNKCLEAL